MENLFRSLIFHPPVEPHYEISPSTIWLKTKSNYTISALFLNRKTEYTVLLSYANAEDLGIAMSFYMSDISISNAVNLFFYDYPGYGFSSGIPSESGMYESVEAAYSYIINTLSIPSEKIILYGRSLGTAACCHLASLYPIKGVILQSPMLSLYRICFPLKINLPGDMFCNIDKIQKIKCPVFIIHGTNDEIIPFYHGVELFKICKTCVNPNWIEGGSHNNLDYYNPTSFYSNLLNFLKYLGVSKK